MFASRVGQMAPLGALVLLTACATTTPESTKQDMLIEPHHASLQAQAGPESISAEPILADQLLNLLTAEFATQYGDNLTALQSYQRQGAALNTPELLLSAQLAAERSQDIVAIEQNLQRWLTLFPGDINAQRASMRSAAAQGDGGRLFKEAQALFIANNDLSFLFAATNYLPHNAQLNHQFIIALSQARRSPKNHSALHKLALKFLDCQLQARTATKLVTRQMLIHCAQQITAATQARSSATHELLWRSSIQLTVQLLTQLRRHFEAIALLKQTTREQADAALKFDLARLLLNLDRPSARKTLDDVIKLDPNHHQAGLLLAVLHIDNSDIRSAQPLLGNIPEQSRWFSDAQYQLGRIADFYNQHKRALLHFRRVQPGIHFQRSMRRTGELLTQLYGLQEFDRWMRLQLRQYPEQSESFYLLDIALTGLERAPAVQLERLSAAVAKLPNSVKLNRHLAQQLEKSGDFVSAAKQWQRLLEIDPNHALAMSSLGNLKVSHLAQPEEGQALLYRASQIEPENPLVLNRLGWALFQLGDLEGALGRLLRAHSLNNNAVVASQLGEVYWQLEKPEKAINLWREALRRFPEARYVRDTIHRLDIDLNGVYE